jgi:hypothetical protein
VLEAGSLTSAKARLLLKTLLDTETDDSELRASFREAVRILAPV